MNLPVAVRRPLVWLVHAALAAAAYALAFALRLDGLSLTVDDPRTGAVLFDYGPRFLATLPVAVAARLAALQAFGLHQGLWRFAGLHDLVRLAYAVAASSLVLFGAVSLGWGWKFVPHSVLVMDAALAFLLLGGVRFVRRVAAERRPAASGPRTVIVGAGQAGEALLRDLRRRGRETPVAFVDDAPGLRGHSIHGVPVRGGVADLARVVAEVGASDVVVAVPSRSGEVLGKAVAATEGVPVRIRVLAGGPGPVRASALRALDVADLLSRPVAALDVDRIRADVAGRRVVVTGGAGSIGSELVRQVLALGPAALTVLDRDENAIHYLADGLAPELPRDPLRLVVADVAQEDQLSRALEAARPDYVLHAAAYKHVPLMEGNPVAAVRNNVLATRLALRVADATGASKFLLVSSDKAVRPTSVMGATKRAAELVLRAPPAGRAVRVAVRFGNVVGSAGSVVPLFLRQIERGGPVTLTHRDATRFFMTIPEASSLVLQAAAMAQGGEVFHLDMGRPVRILDLARRMIALAGFDPERDIEIRETGLRPGEKLHEELLAADEVGAPTTHPQVRVARAGSPDGAALVAELDALEAAARAGDEVATLRALKRLVPEYAPTNDAIRKVLEA